MFAACHRSPQLRPDAAWEFTPNIEGYSRCPKRRHSQAKEDGAMVKRVSVLATFVLFALAASAQKLH